MFDKLAASIMIRKLDWKKIPCPVCGNSDGPVLLSRDRYLLKIDVRLCADCGMVYASRNLCGESLSVFYHDFYRDFYEDLDQVTPEYLYESRDKLKAAYRFLRIKKKVGEILGVVEIGCGLGFFLKECLDSGISDVVGYEPGNLFSSYAVGKLGLGDKIKNEMFQQGKRSPDKANLFVLFHVLEHLENPEAVLAAIHEVINSGWLVLEVPDISQGWHTLGRANFHFGHRSYFSIESLANLLARNGFGVVAYEAENDDGIYPGNLRVFARKRDLEGLKFLQIGNVDHDQIKLEVRSGLRSFHRGSLLRYAARLARP